MKIRAGSNILFDVTTKDRTIEPPALFNPATSVKITLIDPAGTVVIDDVAMSNVSTGLYRYQYQTTGASMLGSWLVWFKATDSAVIVSTPNLLAFTLVAS